MRDMASTGRASAVRMTLKLAHVHGVEYELRLGWHHLCDTEVRLEEIGSIDAQEGQIWG